MKKAFPDELMEELAKLHEEKTASGLDPETGRGRAIEAFLRVAKHHTLTVEEKNAIAGIAMALDADGITRQEAEILQALDDANK